MGWLFFGLEHVFHPQFDETVSSVLTCDVLDGALRAPLHCYQYEKRSGDSLAEGVLLVPLFALGDRSLLTFKLLAVISTLCTLAVWLVVLGRYVGLRTAILFGLLYAFPPLTFARLNLVGTVASHHLINPLVAMQVALVLHICTAPRKASDWIRCVLCGLAAGLGSYFFYAYFIFNSFCLVCVFVCARQAFDLRRVGWLGAGFCAGFSPWIVRQVLDAGGGGYLARLGGGAGVSGMDMLRVFGFNVPHCLGYNYPNRAIGAADVVFVAMLCCGTGWFVFRTVRGWYATGYVDMGREWARCLTSLCIMAYPFYFVLCLAASPMHIGPFEYWPRVGLFAHFGASSLYQYRWMHSVYPFMLAAVAITVGMMYGKRRRAARYACMGGYILLLAVGVGKTLYLWDLQSAGIARYYKGYNYDRFANRSVLAGDVTTYAAARNRACALPRQNGSEAYRCLGIQAARFALQESQPTAFLQVAQARIPAARQFDFMYGVVVAAQEMDATGVSVCRDFLSAGDPQSFPLLWGFRFVGYRRYADLVNAAVLHAIIPQYERWMYADVFAPFALTEGGAPAGGEIEPPMVRGVGMLVGAEMLADPLQQVDYPLSASALAAVVPEPAILWEGVGRGCIETLVRFWRRVQMPPAVDFDGCRKALGREWQRCMRLVMALPPAVRPLVLQGMAREMQRRTVPEIVRVYFREQLKAVFNAVGVVSDD